jgi:hypothetical protein
MGISKDRVGIVSKRFRFLWAVIIVPVLVLLINVIFSEAQTIFSIKSIIVSILFLTITLFGITLVHKRLQREQTERFVLPKLEAALSLPLSDTTTNGCISSKFITDSELAAYETTFNGDEIWVITGDLATELGLYESIVKNNLGRGIKYKIFFAKNNFNIMRIQQLKLTYTQCPQNIEYYELDNDFFFLVAKFDITIYDPYKNVATGRHGYIGLDLPNSCELIVAEVNDNLVDAIASKLLSYITQSKSTKNYAGDSYNE